MNKTIGSLEASLSSVQTSQELEEWVRIRLRKYVPHAAFLMTLGRLYVSGSMPTHRVGVDYPLNLVEEIKTESGALNDPLSSVFLRNERTQVVAIDEWLSKRGDHSWCRKSKAYGIESVLIHGVLDHKKRRFAIVQLINPLEEIVGQSMQVVQGIIRALAESAWRTVELREKIPVRDLVGHPTASLTDTEIKIVQFLALGLSNKEIAKRRGVSDSTIKTQISRTGAKLGASRRSEIVAVGLSMIALLPAQRLVDYED